VDRLLSYQPGEWSSQQSVLSIQLRNALKDWSDKLWEVFDAIQRVAMLTANHEGVQRLNADPLNADCCSC